MSVTHPLRHPIKHGGSTITAVHLARPDDATLRSFIDMGLSGKMDMSSFRMVMGMVSDLTAEAVGRLHPHDIEALAHVAVGFLERPPGATLQ